MAWPDSGTNEVTSTIGAHASMDHQTIDAWEQATDVDLVAGDISYVGECYDYADFAEQAYFYGATTDATHYRRLTVAVGQGHNGTDLGAGVTVQSVWMRELYIVFEGFIVNRGATDNPIRTYANAANYRHMVRGCVVRGTANFGVVDSDGTGQLWVRNCAVLGFASRALYYAAYADNVSVLTSGVYGIQGAVATNCVACGATSECFISCTGNYNLSSDTTAPGANSVKSVDASGTNLFISTTASAEDLHLNPAGSEFEHAHNTGTDLSANFTIDIDNETRPTGANTWDIGADEYVAAAAASGADMRRVHHHQDRQRRAG